MPIKLNLIPQEQQTSKNLGNLIKTLKALGVIGIAAFLIFGIGLGVFFIATTISLNNVNASVTKLSAQVSAQQKSEQQIILIKDRIEKVATIQGLPSSLANLKVIDPFLSNLSGTGVVDQIAIDPTTIVLSVNLKSYADTSMFIDSLQSTDKFGTVSLDSFGLNPKNGYSIEIKTTNKK